MASTSDMIRKALKDGLAESVEVNKQGEVAVKASCDRLLVGAYKRGEALAYIELCDDDVSVGKAKMYLEVESDIDQDNFVKLRKLGACLERARLIKEEYVKKSSG